MLTSVCPTVSVLRFYGCFHPCFHKTKLYLFLIIGEACSVILRGATEQIIGEADRSLHDALCVLTSTVKEPR